MRYDACYLEVKRRKTDQQKTKQNQSVKISQKGAAEQKKVENLTVGQAMGQCEVPLC